MGFQTSQLVTVLPELFVLVMALVILVIDTFLQQERRIVSYILTQLTMAISVFIILSGATGDARVVFDGSYIRDGLSDALKVAIAIISSVAFLYAKDYLRERKLFRGEYYVFGLCSVLGMMVMASAANFITIYLGLELLALSLYSMVAFDRDSRLGSEAAMKYFVLGALASGILLYGMSMVYGVTGSLDFASIAKSSNTMGNDNQVLVFGLVFLVIGIAFKLGAVPFHMWVPDVYHGAPTAVTLFIGSAPKLAGFALAIRILVDGLGSQQYEWQGMLLIMSILSMALGNLTAIAQSNIKRMLAYSTISHVGFIFMGLLAGTSQGYAAAMFYTIVYALMALGAFGIIIILSKNGFEADSIEDFKGLHERNPWYAGMMLLFMFSMTGVPPMVGFFAKLAVLQAVVEIHLVWLALVGVTFSIIGAFYYLRIVKLMYFDSPEVDAPIMIGKDVQMVISLNGLAMIGLGIFPASLLTLCTTVFT